MFTLLSCKKIISSAYKCFKKNYSLAADAACVITLTGIACGMLKSQVGLRI